MKLKAALVGLAALIGLTACNTQSATETIAQLQADIVTACGFQASIADIAAVAATITTVVNPAAGATATVVVSTANSVTAAICKQVQVQKAAEKLGAAPTMTIVVNGVTVTGTIVR